MSTQRDWVFDTLGAVLGAAGAFVLFWFLLVAFRKIILIAGMIGVAALTPGNLRATVLGTLPAVTRLAALLGGLFVVSRLKTRESGVSQFTESL